MGQSDFFVATDLIFWPFFAIIDRKFYEKQTMNRTPRYFIIAGIALLIAAFVTFQQSRASIFDGTKTPEDGVYGVCLDAPDPDKIPQFFVDHKECLGTDGKPIDCTTPANSVKAFCISESRAGTGLAKDSLSSTGITHTDNLGDYIKKLVNFSLPYLTLAAFVGYVAAGFLYVTSFGNEEMMGKAKKILIWSTVGLILVILSFAITNLLTGGLVEALNPKP